MPKFTFDWFSHNIPVWGKLLSRFKGQEGLRFLEIGCFEGRATLWLLKNILTGFNSKITCVDPFTGNPEHIKLGADMAAVKRRFFENIRQHASRVTVFKGKSDAFWEDTNVLFDFIYIDGSHKAADVLVDAINGWRNLIHGGVMIFDDYEWDVDLDETEKPKMGIDAFLEKYQGEYKLLHMGYQVILEKRLPF